MLESADFGETLNSLAVFGASIGTTVGNVYKNVNPSTVPNTNIPQSSYNVTPSGARPKVQVGDILLYVVIAIGVIFGIKMLRK